MGRLTAEEMEVWSQPAHKRPTAAVCFNDTFAYRLIAYCAKIGLRVPEDLAVVGFDGALAWHAHPKQLTTVHAPWDLVAETAIDVVLDLIDNKPVPEESL